MSALRVTAQKNPPSGAGCRYTGALARNQRYCSNGCPLLNDAAEYKSIWMSGAFVLSVLVMPFPPSADAVCVDWRAKAPKHGFQTYHHFGHLTLPVDGSTRTLPMASPDSSRAPASRAAASG